MPRLLIGPIGPVGVLSLPMPDLKSILQYSPQLLCFAGQGACSVCTCA